MSEPYIYTVPSGPLTPEQDAELAQAVADAQVGRCILLIPAGVTIEQIPPPPVWRAADVQPVLEADLRDHWGWHPDKAARIAAIVTQELGDRGVLV